MLGRIRERGITYWADPFERRAGEVYREDGDCGFYWRDQDGHVLELITAAAGAVSQLTSTSGRS